MGVEIEQGVIGDTEHEHAAIDHAHKDRDPDSELREHNEMAHVHDHERPTG